MSIHVRGNEAHIFTKHVKKSKRPGAQWGEGTVCPTKSWILKIFSLHNPKPNKMNHFFLKHQTIESNQKQ